MSPTESDRHTGGILTRFAVRNWAAIALVALAAVFIGQNRDRQRVHFLWIEVESPMWLLLAVMLLVGIVAGMLLHRRRRN